MKNAFFENPHNEIKCVLSIEGSNFDEKNETKFSHLPTVGAEGLTVSLTVKRALFYDSPNDYDAIDVDIGVVDVAVDIVIACNAWVRCASANASFRRYNLGIGTVESRL